jgi:type I restriction enzyme S subunit
MSVPKLRFSEFRDIWTTKKLGELGKLIGGGTPNKSVPEYWQGEIPWISSSDIFDDNIHNISITRYINEKSISESATKIVPKGSVLFVSRVGTGKLAINDKEVCTSQDFTNFIPDKIHNYFLGYFFAANKSILTSLDQGTSIKGFSKSDLEKFELSFPCESEQQKIANCLASLDELIAAQTQKLDALKTHKKGLMQQLFPSANEVAG